MAGVYDLMLLIDPNAPEERRTSAVSEAESLLSSGGEIVAQQDWGQRRMAYEIDHRPEAEYRLYQFNGDKDLLERLNQRLRINDAVLRFRIIKSKPGAPLPPAPDQQSARRREEREPQDTRVAARAAADAPAASDAARSGDRGSGGRPCARRPCARRSPGGRSPGATLPRPTPLTCRPSRPPPTRRRCRRGRRRRPRRGRRPGC